MLINLSVPVCICRACLKIAFRPICVTYLGDFPKVPFTFYCMSQISRKEVLPSGAGGMQMAGINFTHALCTADRYLRTIHLIKYNNVSSPNQVLFQVP